MWREWKLGAPASLSLCHVAIRNIYSTSTPLCTLSINCRAGLFKHLPAMFTARVQPFASRFVATNSLRIATSSLRRPYSSPSSQTYEYLKVSTPRTGVALIELNRPKALNALFTPLITELNACAKQLDKDSSIGAIVLTGSPKAFAAGADIKEMAPKTFGDVYGNDFIESWNDLTLTKKPIISAVNGYALGGGCELAMMADIVYCSASANFGQPEIKLGVIPGAGGSQRLTKGIGKSRAMEMILTGDNLSGTKAGEWGLAAKVFEDAEKCVEGALDTAEKIAGYSRLAVKAAKEVVNKSQDLGIREGVEFERRVFHGLFGSQDQKIGMKAFAEKKKAEWTHE
ncbi:hypothetical protein M8818_007754 [Zalaria obscura]|uniref:Uncharacterized protein n=1 Tax=Zalaria obscura TaxID=2024903 RepID=A0ACC3S2L3_9PEZI